MNAMLITCIILTLISSYVGGFTLATILSLVTTVMFCGRKFQYYAKLETIVTMECLGIFMTTMWSLLFKHFDLWTFIIFTVIRLIFVCIALYDSTQYVYYTKKYRIGQEDK